MTSPADVHAAKLAIIEAAADAPEALRERVARAMFESCYGGTGFGWDDQTEGPDLGKAYYRSLADAAIATISTPVEGAPAGCGADAALRRVLALADYYETDDEPDLPRTQVAIFRAVARDIRGAVER